REKLNGKLEIWRQALEAHDFHISRSKTILGIISYHKSLFTYRGLTIQDNEEIDVDINDMIQVGWMNGRMFPGVVCNENVSLKLKMKFYCHIDTQCWA
ncbi:hypothetical protein Lal_00004046, partial [Lupinus albus]